MSYKIFCTDSKYPFSIWVDSLEKEDFDIDCSEMDDIKECLDEWISDIICEIEAEATGFFPDEWLYDCPLYDKARDKVDKLLEEKMVIIDEDDESKVLEQEVDLSEVIDRIFDYRNSGEQSYVDVGAYAIKCLERFLSEGKWQYALRSQSGELYSDTAKWNLIGHDGKRQWKHENEILETCLWFGIPGQALVECWEIHKLKELFELDNYEVFDWNTLMGIPRDEINIHAIWMFAECGMSEPNNEDLLASCPIKLDSNDSKEELYAKIDQFFLEKYNSVHK